MAADPTTILLVAKDTLDVPLLRSGSPFLSTGAFRLERVPGLDQACARLKDTAHPPDVILLDLALPGSQAPEALESLGALRAAAPDVPLIVLHDGTVGDLVDRALQAGAGDELAVPRMDAEICRRVLGWAIQRQRGERSLREIRQRYDHLLRSTSDYTYRVEIENGRAKRAVHGPGCEAVTGYVPADYQSDPGLWYRMVPEEDRPAVLKQVARLMKGRTPPPIEHRVVHQGGTVRWVRSTVVPVFDSSGKLVAYDGLVSNITERKQTEERLLRSEAFYHSLVQHLPQNIFRKDLSERFTFASERFCQMLGKPLNEIIGRTDWDFYPPELAAKFQRDDREVIRTGNILETIEENLAPSGELIYVQVVKTPIRDAAGQILGTQCIFWDITERKRFEEQLQKKNAELAASEAALRRSHQDLRAAQLQLVQAEKMESIGTLAAGVAHEVKNPLAILQMGVNYLSKKAPPGDENISMVLQEMKEAITRADSITRSLLDFAASKQLAMHPEDINQLIQETFRMVRHELEGKPIEIVTDLKPGLPKVSVDKTQIQQVFVNVLTNAIHAMPEGGTLTVRTFLKHLTESTHFEGSRNADHLWVGDAAIVAEVEDTGTGIPEEFLARIFDPFFTTKPTGLGTGLGLPVSKKMIELHGGTMTVRNKPEGKGAKVTITLRERRS